MDVFLFLLYLLSSFLGLLSIALGLPGNFIILAVTGLYAWRGGFEQITGYTLLWLALLAAFAEAMEFGLGIVGAKRWKSSNTSVAVSFITGFLGAVAGAPLWLGAGSLPGAFIGAFLGAFLTEYVRGLGFRRALSAGWGVFVGRVGGVMVKGFIGVGMIVISVVSIARG